MNIEMKYHNVYYYCGILNNVIEYQQEEFFNKIMGIFTCLSRNRYQKSMIRNLSCYFFFAGGQ